MKRPDKATLIQLYTHDGLTDAQIAKKYGVAPSTVFRWRRHYNITIVTEQLYRVRLTQGEN